MKASLKIILVIALALLAGSSGCAGPQEIHAPAAAQTGNEGVATQPEFTVQMDDKGKARDKQGVEITADEISRRLKEGLLTQSMAIVVLVRGTQKEGVLETTKMFSSFGFKSVVIRLIVNDPIR